MQYEQAALGPQTSVFLSDVETDVWAPGTVANLSLQSARWLVTRGELGADEVTGGETVSLPPEKVRFCSAHTSWCSIGRKRRACRSFICLCLLGAYLYHDAARRVWPHRSCCQMCHDMLSAMTLPAHPPDSS